jgi:hypothetical protein
MNINREELIRAAELSNQPGPPQTQDKPAAQVIREFMRDYVEHHGPSVAPADRPSPSAAADPEGDA